MNTDIRKGHTSASNAAADTLCKARHLMQKQVTEPDKPSEDAEFGTQIHAALASRKPDALDEQQLSIYEACIEIEEKKLAEWFVRSDPDLMTVTEERYWVKFKAGDKILEHSGQVDRIYRNADKALVVEYKTLPGDTPASPENLQVRDQVALVHGNLKINDIGAVVIQPLVTRKPTICHYNTEALKRAAKEMMQRVAASNTPGQEPTPGEVQCKYCRANNICEPYAIYAQNLMPVVKEFAPKPVKEWTPKEMAVFLEKRSIAAKWLDECENYIREFIVSNPEAVPGWKIGEGQTRSKVNDMNELWRRLFTRGCSPEDFADSCSMTKANIEKLMRKLTSAKGKALTTEIKSLLDGIVEETKTKGSLERTQ